MVRCVGTLLLACSACSTAGAPARPSADGGPSGDAPHVSDAPTDVAHERSETFDAAVLPARAAASFRVQPGMDASRCAVFSHIGATGDPPVTRNDASGPRAVDGEGASVRCRVGIAGGGFEVSAAVVTQSASLEIESLGAIVNGSPASAVLRVHTPQAGDLEPAPGSSCTVDVGSAPLTVGAGRIWAGFSCPMLTGGTFATSACTADGVFVFENCSG